jgi:hypothetical protein
MRLKKLLPLILLAVGTLFLLSSCDAILNALYANNTIIPTVAVSIAHIDFSIASVQVNLGGASGGVSSAYFSGTTSGGYAYYYCPSLTRLPNGTYTITTSYYGTSHTYLTNSFQDPSGATVTSITMPYDGSTSANVLSVIN